MSAGELRSRLEAWADEEVRHAEKILETAKNVKSPLVRAVLTAVAMDSQKHRALLLEAVRLVEGKGEGPAIAEADESLARIREHVEVEEEALRFFEAAVRDPAVAQDPQLSFILKLILRDEAFHHVMLHDLYQALVRGRLLGHGEEWEELYRELDKHL